MCRRFGDTDYRFPSWNNYFSSVKFLSSPRIDYYNSPTPKKLSHNSRGAAGIQTADDSAISFSEEEEEDDFGSKMTDHQQELAAANAEAPSHHQ